MTEAATPVPGDKIAVLRGNRRGERGVIVEVRGEGIVVRLEDDEVTLPTGSFQNFSAAARKAWQTMPRRRTGRPKNPSLPLKRMVSLRVDAEVWDALGRAAENGLIRSREAAVNEWLREKLAQTCNRQVADNADQRDGA